MKFRQRGGNQEDFEIQTIEDLFNLERVKYITDNPRNNFHRFSLAHPENWQIQAWGKKIYDLMQENNEGYEWWVIGYIYDATEDLINHFPKWESKYKENEK